MIKGPGSSASMGGLITALGKMIHVLGLDEKRCAACHVPYEQDLPYAPSGRLCPICQNLLIPYAGPRCGKCGLPWAGAKVCPNCAKNPPPWAGLAYHGLYDGLLRELILRLKFSADLSLVPLLGDFLLQACLRLPPPDCLTAIPQYPASLRKRGFNQAHEVARRLRKITGLSLSPGLVKRIKTGPPQETLTAQAREANMRDAFVASTRAQGRIIWLIDDVITTGSTCRYATQALLKAGAREVYVLGLARTPLP